MAVILRQSTQIVVRVGPFVDETDGVTPQTGITLGAADQAEALKAAGAATVDISAATWAAITGADGWYNLTLTTSHTDTVGELLVVVQDASACLPVFMRFQVIEEALYDGIYAASAAVIPANVTQFGGSAGTFSGGRPEVNTSHAAGTAWGSGAITAAAIATGAIDADALAADAGTEIGTAVWATATRSLTVLDEDSTTLDLDATIRAAVGLAAADLDTQLAALPTAAENADAVWDEDATGHQTQGTFGQAIGDPAADTNTIYKAVVTDAAGANVAADIIAVKAETATILADTNELQTDWVNGGRLDLILDARASQTSVDTINGIVDAILVDTGTDIPALISTLESGLATDAEIADAVWDEAIAGHAVAGSTGEALSAAGSAGDPWSTALPGAYGAGTAGKIIGDNINAPIGTVDTVVDAIKAKTDSLTFTVANQVDANIKSVAGTTVTGVGSEADPWGP
jgi:hypothetical protein